MNILVIAMPGCGNYGDDLISDYLHTYITSLHENAIIGYLSGDINNSCEKLCNNKLKLLYPKKNNLNIFISRNKDIYSFVNKCDYIYIGGGGLLQDSHNMFTPHKYLKWILFAKCPIVLVGIGVGPVKYYHNIFYIRNILNSKGLTIQVRDNESLKLLKAIGVINNIQIGCDIVEGSKISTEKSNNKNTHVLGCSIRPWPDFNIEIMVKLIREVIIQNDIYFLCFFVFEYAVNNTGEYDFQLQIKNILGDIPSEIIVYGKNLDFIDKFYTVNKAIASRYHANVLWQKYGIPVLPIPYAPKVFSLYSKHNIKIFPLDDVINFQLNFYNINISESYNLPNILNENLKLSYFNKTLIVLFDLAAFIYESTRSLLIRLKRILRN